MQGRGGAGMELGIVMRACRRGTGEGGKVKKVEVGVDIAGGGWERSSLSLSWK